jgi:hypothetical protein
MSVFTTSIKNNRDLAKNWLFNIIFEFDEGSALSTVIGTDEFIIRAKTATIPQKDFGELTTEYMGSKLVYPGKATMAGTFDVQFDEFQDMYISKALHRWQNLLFNGGFQNDIDVGGITGGASSNYLKDYCATVRVVLFDSSLKTKLPVEYKFYYVWPKTVATVSLGMESSEKIQRQCTFNYSTFELVATGE